MIFCCLTNLARGNGFVTFVDSTHLSLITNLWGDSACPFHLVMKIPAWSNGYILGVRVQIWLYWFGRLGFLGSLLTNWPSAYENWSWWKTVSINPGLEANDWEVDFGFIEIHSISMIIINQISQVCVFLCWSPSLNINCPETKNDVSDGKVVKLIRYRVWSVSFNRLEPPRCH